jgi:hypothetical protein
MNLLHIFADVETFVQFLADCLKRTAKKRK